MDELDGIGETQGLGHPVHHMEAAVVSEGRANVVVFAAAKVSSLAASMLVVDDNRAAQ